MQSIKYQVTLRPKRAKKRRVCAPFSTRTAFSCFVLSFACSAILLRGQWALASINLGSDRSAGKSKLQFSNAPISDKKPVVLTADEMQDDRPANVTLARGHVEVVQGDAVLLADELRYYRNENRVVAIGNVAVMEPSGNVYFADSVTLNHELQQGVIEQFRARLNDESLFAANSARQDTPNKIVLSQAVYSPCSLQCQTEEEKKSGEPPAAPLWQMKADELIYDQEEHTLEYHDATFEWLGLPIFYTPYLTHASPGASNKTGLMFPQYKHSSNLGSVISLPVYIAIAPDRDLTLTPIITTEEGPVIVGQYRQQFDTGKLRFEASATDPQNRDAAGNITSGRKFRWHVDGKADFQYDPHTTFGGELRRASDDTYLRRYDFSNETQLTSRLYGESTKLVSQEGSRSHALVEMLGFQGLTAQDDSHKNPYAVPLANASWSSPAGPWGDRFTMQGNVLALTRDIGVDSKRVSVTGAWNVPYITPSGHVFGLEASLRADNYTVNNVIQPAGNSFDGTTQRAIPQLMGTWRYPLIYRMQDSSLLVEPQVDLIASTRGGNTEKIPNEDSRVPEFSDINLFSADRFPGLDRVESGLRANIGMRAQYSFDQGKQINALIGQHYRATNDPEFPLSNDLRNHYSDYVGKIGISADPVELSYRFRLDQGQLDPKRSEVEASYQSYPLAVNMAYLKLIDDPILQSKEELAENITLALDRQWSVFTSAHHDLQQSELTSAYAGVGFTNECTRISLTLGRQYVRDRDVQPDTTVLFRVSLKNLN